MRRVILVLADGLRPDVVTTNLMPALTSLSRAYASAREARTIRPSVTVAALASLATGVAPERHNFIEPGLSFLSSLSALRLLPVLLRSEGLPTMVVSGAVAWQALPVVRSLVRFAGVANFLACQGPPEDIAERALRSAPEEGLVFLYWNDCDRAGHRHGWMSGEYLAAARGIDRGIGRLAEAAEHSLVFVMADHGGGGVVATDHDAPHEVNDRIPLILAGPEVRRRHVIAHPVSLLDVPPTILSYLDTPIPSVYSGRPLTEAFDAVPMPMEVAS